MEGKSKEGKKEGKERRERAWREERKGALTKMTLAKRRVDHYFICTHELVESLFTLMSRREQHPMMGSSVRGDWGSLVGT